MYDVIVVGGRPAGSSLAVRLGRAGLRVLLLERDALPSRPAASSPIIYAPAMKLLDEIGACEADYARHTPRLSAWTIEADAAFRVTEPVPCVDGRDYAYAIDRARFDQALWQLAAATVTARQRTAVIDLVVDSGAVCGVIAKNLDTGETQEVRAGLVVGADGRFSTVARKVDAAVHHEHTTEPTSVYYAYWRGVTPLEQPTAHLFSTGGDYGLLLMDSAEDTTVVVIEGRSDQVHPAGRSAEAFYTAFLQAHPAVWARLQHAERVTDMHGMKRVRNLYRQAGGPGWALVGDALHQKDPLDGQGIYDALYTAKALALAIVDWKNGTSTWNAALSGYEAAVYKETYAMYEATLARVHREIYTRRPGWFMRYPARWLYEDPAYRKRWARLFVRDIDPAEWFSYRSVGAALWRGFWRDL